MPNSSDPVRVVEIADGVVIPTTPSGVQDVNIVAVPAGGLESEIVAEYPDGITRPITATIGGGLRESNIETNPAGALPVSQLTTLHDGKVLNRLMPELMEIVGTGSATLSGGNKIDMAVGVGQWVVNHTRRFLPYYSGKVQKVELTFDDFAPEPGLVKLVGYFSSNTASPYDADYDGFYLESGNGTIKFVVKRSGTVTVEADITEWQGYAHMGNYQTLANWDNFTVVEVNFLWLGGAYIELRLVTAYGFLTVFSAVYAGTSPDVFMKSPNQPVRYEIRSTTGAGNMRYICNQVATGGSISESGLSKGVNTGHAAFNLASIGTTYPVLAVRKGANFRENAVKIKTLNLNVATSNDQLLWTLQINPTMSAPLTYTAVANSAIEKANGDGVITVTSPGIVIATDNLETGSKIPENIFEENFLAWLSGSITGTQDEYVLCATPSTVTIGVKAAMNLAE